MSTHLNVAVVGATTLVGETVLKLLDESELSISTLYPVESGEAAGGRAEFRGKHLRVEPVERFDFSRVQVAIFCVPAAQAAAWVPAAIEAGCAVVDTSPQFRDDPAVPLIVAGVNDEAQTGRMVASPCAGSILLAHVLAPLHEAVGLARVNVVTMQAVSGAGRAGIEELGRQTAHLLNLKPIEPEVFPRQITFNLLPQIGAIGDDGVSGEERKFALELRRVLGLPALGVNATAVRVPVFFGHSAAIHVETARKITAAEARALLGRVDGIEIVDGRNEGEYPTPVTDAADQDEIWVGRVREDTSHPRGLDLWVVCDNVRILARNAVAIAERLEKNYA